MRKRKKAPAELVSRHILELPAANPKIPPEVRRQHLPAKPIDWQQLFGNDNPVELEVGFGKGLFLVNAATQQPGKNFFGIEIVRKYQVYAANRLAVRNLSNAVTCCADAKLVLRDSVMSATVDAVHVYFPDPWWKTRNKKRLLFTPWFGYLVAGVLKPAGKLHFVTDVKEYFEWVTTRLAELPLFDELPRPVEQAPGHDMDYLTNFERKFRKEGRPIYRALYQRNDLAVPNPLPVEADPLPELPAENDLQEQLPSQNGQADDQ